MSSSRPQSPNTKGALSLARAEKKCASESQANLFCPAPGSMNDELMVRGIVTSAIKSCGKSREQVAEAMSVVLGIDVTARMISAFTSESKELHRWPGAWDRAFCYVTSDERLLLSKMEAAGYRCINADEVKLLELGRQTLLRKKAEKTISAIEQDFEGVDL